MIIKNGLTLIGIFIRVKINGKNVIYMVHCGVGGILKKIIKIVFVYNLNFVINVMIMGVISFKLIC